MAIIGDLTDYAKNTSGIRDYINGQYEHDGKDGEEVSTRACFKRTPSLNVSNFSS